MGTEDLNKVIEALTEKTIFCTKEILTFDEACRYMGVSKSTLYNLTMRKEIPHYKPTNGRVFFQRTELEQWILNSRISTDQEISHKASSYCQRTRH